MDNNEPKPIKDYYIAYFDILGYKEFFRNSPEKVPDFLNMIHTGIQGTISKISSANQSALVASVASMNIEVRVFSDNILLCLENMNTGFEKIRLLSFIMMVSYRYTPGWNARPTGVFYFPCRHHLPSLL